MTKPNTGRSNCWTTLNRPWLLTCHSFHFQSLVVKFLEWTVTLQEP